MKKLFSAFSGFLAFALLPAALYAQQTSLVVPRSITVSGEARADTAPDQAVLSMSIVSRSPDLAKAKVENDAKTEKVLKIVKEFSIPQEKLMTSGVQISPEYQYSNNEQKFVGYMVNRSLRLIIAKIEIQERVLSALVDAKVDQVNGVEFQLSKPEETAAKLRVQAFENARARATALAQASGDKLGKAITISTTGSTDYPRPPMPVMAMKAEFARGAADSAAPSLPGLITQQESVHVTFALE